MRDTFDPQFFAQYVSGQATEVKPMINLLAQVFVILIVGIALWRISAIFGKKNKNRKQSIFTDSNFQNWKNQR